MVNPRYPKRRHATPSEPITWTRIHTPTRSCRNCGKFLKLDDVAHFGTDRRGTRFVECKTCFDTKRATT